MQLTPIIMDVHTGEPYYQNYYYNGYSNYNQLIGYDTDVNTYKEGTLRLSLVDSETKILFGKARSTVFIKAKMNLKLLQNLWMICS
jgi:hypothetical protein